MKIKNDKIENYIKKLIFKKKIPTNFKKVNLLRAEYLDSLAMFKLILKIESKYKIKIKDNELFSKKFENISGIVNLIKKKLK